MPLGCGRKPTQSSASMGTVSANHCTSMLPLLCIHYIYSQIMRNPSLSPYLSNSFVPAVENIDPVISDRCGRHALLEAESMKEFLYLCQPSQMFKVVQTLVSITHQSEKVQRNISKDRSEKSSFIYTRITWLRLQECSVAWRCYCTPGCSDSLTGFLGRLVLVFLFT